MAGTRGPLPASVPFGLALAQIALCPPVCRRQRPFAYPVHRGASKSADLWPLLTADDICAVREVSKNHYLLVHRAWFYVRRRVVLGATDPRADFVVRREVHDAVMDEPELLDEVIAAGATTATIAEEVACQTSL